MTTNFESDEHALLTGMLLGLLLKHGIDAEPGIDENGDYTQVITVNTKAHELIAEIALKVVV